MSLGHIKKIEGKPCCNYTYIIISSLNINTMDHARYNMVYVCPWCLYSDLITERFMYHLDVKHERYGDPEDGNLASLCPRSNFGKEYLFPLSIHVHDGLAENLNPILT